jgi:GNAT superfamily N-acetyltransferase
MTATVRPAREADGPAIYRAWQALRTLNAGIDPRVIQVPVSEVEFMAGLRDGFNRPNARVFVAEAGGRIAGFISAAIEVNQPDRLPERHVTVGYLYVDPAHRRQGVARALLEAVREWARSLEGVVHLEMTVLEADGEAARFWEAAGFRPFIQRLWAPLDAHDAP